MIASGEIDDRLLAVAAVFDDLLDYCQQAVVSAKRQHPLENHEIDEVLVVVFNLVHIVVMIFAANELLSRSVVGEDGGLFEVDLFRERIKRDEIPVETFVAGTHFATSFPASAA